jgi:RNase P/RNase MRP subunit p30
MIDIVMPHGNEKEFLEMSKELGFDKLCFAYSLADFPLENVSGVSKAIICKPEEVNKARRKAKLVIVESSDANRLVIEKLPFDIIYNLENMMQRDKTHTKSSGLNQVLCELLGKRKKVVAFNLNSLLKANKGLRSVILGRMMQNVRLCRKYKVKMVIVSLAKTLYEMRAAHDMIAFGITLGMHPSEAKLALKANL